MASSFDCVLDLSGSMEAYNKHQIGLALLYALRQAARNSWPLFPWQGARLSAWAWQDDVRKFSPQTCEPKGCCNLQALRAWLESQDNRDAIILIGDGHWGELRERREFAAWLKESPYQLAPIATGPDADFDFLSRISLAGIAFVPDNLASLFQHVSKAPLFADLNLSLRANESEDDDDDED